MASMSEKRNEDERRPLHATERPRGVRHNVSSLAGLLLIFIAAITYGSYFYGIPGHAVRSQAEVILAENPLIDGHNDLLILLRSVYGNQVNGDNFTKPFEHGGLAGHVDVPRLQQGQQGGAFWSTFANFDRERRWQLRLIARRRFHGLPQGWIRFLRQSLRSYRKSYLGADRSLPATVREVP